MRMHISRRFEFDMAHRVNGHECKCANLHGHRYVAIFHFAEKEDKLDKLGRMIDFARIKDILGDWIDREMDHNICLHVDDPMLPFIEDANNRIANLDRPLKPIFVLQHNPTAENLAKYMLLTANILLQHHEVGLIYCSKVTLYETPNCYAEWSLV